ncbi:MAG: hypothetical protein ABW068_06095 [Candidatus Thiodiazotropha sp.]
MDEQFLKMVEVNVKGRVFVVCQSRGVTDVSVINYYTEVVQQAVLAQMTEDADTSAESFHRLLEQQVEWLGEKLRQLVNDGALDRSAADGVLGDPVLEVSGSAAAERAEKKASGFVPEAKSMPERLKDRRAEMEHLLTHDCITLKLLTANEAKQLKRELVGRLPEKAEEELVARMRSVLHSQVSKFIRKHQGGPWQTVTQQTEIRMEIAHTKSLRSLVFLSRQLLQEREEWMLKTKSSLVGRLFGGRVKLNKP